MVAARRKIPGAISFSSGYFFVLSSPSTTIDFSVHLVSFHGPSIIQALAASKNFPPSPIFERTF